MELLCGVTAMVGTDHCSSVKCHRSAHTENEPDCEPKTSGL